MKSERNLSVTDLMFTINLFCSSIVALFFFCEFGEMVSNRFGKFDEKIFQQIVWYLFPIEVQQWLVAFMPTTQRSMVFRGYGNIQCTREAFKRVN